MVTTARTTPVNPTPRPSAPTGSKPRPRPFIGTLIYDSPAPGANLEKQEVKDAVEGIKNGSIATTIKSKTRYAVTGILIGAAAGIVVASFTGQSRVLFALGGAGIGGGTGYLLATRK